MRSQPRTRHALVLAAAVLALTACGSGSSSTSDPGRDPGESGVREVLDTIAPALARGDAARVCSLAGAEAQRRIEHHFKVANCIDAIAPALADLDETDRATLASGTTWDIAVASGQATVTGTTADTLSAALGLGTLTLIRVEGRWALG